MLKHAKTMIFLMIVLCMALAPITVSATSIDNINGNGSATNANDTDTSNAISDYIKGSTPVTDENMSRASVFATPVANLIGTITGFVMIVVVAGIALVTSLDLAYIGIPFVRPYLNPAMAQGGAQGGGMGMGGMGMRGGMMGGGAQAQPAGRVWVSEEAINALAKAQATQAGGAQPQGGGMGMGGMGMGGMGMGGMGMGGGAQAQPAGKPKSAIADYLIHRVFFIILFACASVVLLSSILTGCGINVASLLLKIVNLVSGNINNVQI